MGYTIGDFIKSNQFSEIKLLCDNSSVEREIQGIQILAVPDMEKFAGGGELLLTSLKAYENLNENTVLYHLEELYKKKVVGFAVKRVQDRSQQIKLFDVFMQFCNKYNIPVLELPENVTYWSVIKFLLPKIYSYEVAKMIYSKITHDDINYFLTEGAMDKTILETLFKKINIMIGNPIALYDERFINIYSSLPEESNLVITKDVKKYMPNIIAQHEYMIQKRKYVEYIRKINILDQSVFFLVATEVNEPLSDFDFITLGHVLSALLYILIQKVTTKALEKKYHRDLEHRILNGTLSDEEENEVAHVLNLNMSNQYRVIIFCLKSKHPKDNFSEVQRTETEFVEKIISDCFPKEYIYSNTNRIIYIHKENTNEDKLNYRKELEKIRKNIQNQLINRKSDFELIVGLGKVVEGYHRLKESFEDAKLAIKYIDIIRDIVGDMNKSVVDCSKLGFFHIFANIKDKAQLRTYIPDSVNNIYKHDLQKNSELLHTLECYLNHKQSIRKTSELMCIHSRTVSYRLQKIVQLTGMDYDNIAEMLTVRNGIIILKILEKL